MRGWNNIGVLGDHKKNQLNSDNNVNGGSSVGMNGDGSGGSDKNATNDSGTNIDGMVIMVLLVVRGFWK